MFVSRLLGYLSFLFFFLLYCCVVATDKRYRGCLWKQCCVDCGMCGFCVACSSTLYGASRQKQSWLLPTVTYSNSVCSLLDK